MRSDLQVESAQFAVKMPMHSSDYTIEKKP